MPPQGRATLRPAEKKQEENFVSLKRWMFINAIVFIAFGIAFALYAPLVAGVFGILNTEGTSEMYWYSVSFARLYGAALFGFGFLIWGVSYIADSLAQAPGARRSVLAALLVANGMGVIVALTQQVSIWGVLAGWITVGMYAVLMTGYIIALVKRG
jgi:hypothetical protein